MLSKKLKKVEKIFEKPIDKSKKPAIIKVQKERTKQKMFQSFIKTKRTNQWTDEFSRKKSAGRRRDTAKNKRKEGTKSDDSFPLGGGSLTKKK